MTKKVLIVDDGEAMRLTIGAIIEGMDRSVELFYTDNGRTLVEMMQKEKYDLVLTDNDMPTLTGIEAIREIREYDKITLIYVVATLTNSQVRSLTNAGATGYIQKGAEISKKLGEVVKGHLIN